MPQPKDIRALYLDFFKQKGHIQYDSMPLVPDDESLLFTNAGMVQFKDIFTGKIPAPSVPRATSSQLCIRAGGKHNDLENVGYTARHHTLFEMLGNFSFGDYFKREAIAYAWEFVTQILGFDKRVIYVSVHESDDEAYHIWSEYLEVERIKKMGDKDNFWQMGDSGPCGPCSEIYIDQGDKYFNSSEDYFGGEGDRFLEIWNLVFMQYEQQNGVRSALPKPSIDTGMGLERVIALKEGKINNFDTSLFAPLMQKISSLTDKTYHHDDWLFDNPTQNLAEVKAIQASFRVIADHSRSVAFLLAQGVYFDREGRGYVLRRILRRGVRHGYLLGLRKAFMYEVVGVVCESMGAHYGYLLERKEAIMQQCKAEEERFFETIENGMSLFNKELDSMRLSKASVFNGEVAFKLYDTYGFPLDLTQDMLREHNISIDMQGFQSCMDKQKLQAKASWKGSGDESKSGDFKDILDEFGENTFVGYESDSADSKVLALLDSEFKRINCLAPQEKGYILLDKTPFYPEGGGPVGDKGLLLDSADTIAQVLDTKKYFGLNLSQIQAIKPIELNQTLLAKVDIISRQEIAKHHSATHLLHLALREVLGEHIAQAGSLVESHRLRFDFSHPSAISADKLRLIEDSVNERIYRATPQDCEYMSLDKAKSSGAIALFGQKYGDNVRVITFGDSKELCGGIHIDNTAQIGSFYIIKESGVSSGVRRIEAVCGRAGHTYALDSIQELNAAKSALKTQNLISSIEKLKSTLKEQEDMKSKARQSVKTFGFTELNGVKLMAVFVEDASNSALKDMIDRVKNEEKRVAALLISHNDSKVSMVAGVKNAPINAKEWIKSVANELGGDGGGRDDFATAGGKLPSDEAEAKASLNKALQQAHKFAKEALETK